MNAILGEKLGMTQIFDDANRAVPVTAVKAGPVVVTQIKRPDTDGYAAIQIAFKEISADKAGRPAAGHFAKAGVAPHRHVIEVRVDDPDAYELGQTITIADVLEEGNKVQFIVRFRGRENAHPETGRAALDKIMHEIVDVAKLERMPRYENRVMTMIVAPK